MPSEKPGFTLLDTVEVIARHRITIGLSLVTGLAVAGLLALVVPRTYTARASVLPESGETTHPSFPMAGMLASLGDIAPGYALPAFERGSQAVGLLESRTLLDRVLARQRLLDGAPATRADSLAALDGARRRWSRRIHADRDEASGVIQIEVEARDPETAAGVANALVDGLHELNRQLAYSAASATRAFTETRLTETRRALADAQRALVEFQDRHGAVALTEQAGEMVKELAALEGEIVALRAARGAASVDYAASLGTVRQIDAQIDVLERERKRLLGERPPDAAPEPPGAGAQAEAPAARDDDRARALVPLLEVPGLSAEYANLLLDVKIQESVLTVLHQQLEQSKIAEARDVPVLQILDRATPPVRHSSPRRSLMLVMGAVAGAMIGLVIVSVEEWSARNRDEAARFRRVLRSLTGRAA